MASDDRFWTKKLIVWNISQQCSTDHLVNYLEVMTKKIVVENGVEYFQNISHAALVTLTEPLTDTDLAAAQSQCDKELLEDSNIILISISEPPMAILVHNEKSQLSHDNIFYYFDSCVSGCEEGSVVSCEMFPLLGLAVVTFKSSTVAKAALARKEHSPDNVSTFLVEPCYNDFHMTLLQELNRRALADCKVPVPSTFMESTSSACKPLSTPSDNVTVVANKLSGSDTPTKTESVLATSSHRSSPLFPKVSEVTLLSTVTSTTLPSNKPSTGPMPQLIHNQKLADNDIFPADKAGFSSAQLSLRCAEENIEEFEYLTLNKDYVGKTSLEKCEMLNSDCTALDCKAYGRGLEESKEFPGQMQGAHQWKDKHGQTNCFSRTLDKSELTENFDDLTPKCGRKMDMDQNDDTVTRHSASLNQLEDFSSFDTQMPDFFQQRYDTETGIHEGRGMLASYHGFIHEPESSSTLKQSSSDRLLSVASETASLDTLNNWESQELAGQRVENQVFFKSQKVMTVKVPAYCLRLLTDFCTENHGCKLTILEKQDMVEFNGTEEDCENAKSKLLECIQNLEKDSLQLSPPFGMMLQTVKGQQYLEKLHQVHPNCSVTVDVNCVKCAAHNSKDVTVLLEDIKKDLYQETLLVQSRCFTSTHFMELKSQLEKEHMVHISINNFTGQLVIAGIKGFDGMAVKVLQNFCKQFQACNNEFVIPGSLADRACSQWYISHLDRVKELIIANGGTVKQLSNTNGYSLKFECPKDIKKELQTNLNDIRSRITSCTTTVDLTSKFTSYSDRALVINGLNAMGIEQFCVGFEQTLKKQGVDCFLAINLPPRCPLPKCFLTRACGKRDSQQYRQEKHGAVAKSSHKRRTHHHINTGRPSPFKPVSITLGTTRISIKCGDITSENVNVLVSIVAEDLQMKNTAVGAAFLKKYPEAEKELKNAVSEEDDVNKVIVTHISPQNFRGRKESPAATHREFTASCLFHVIIGQWPPQSVHTHVKVLVQKCLQKAVEAHQISIAFPPLGIGKRFKLPTDVVANAMLAGTQEFLRTSPDLLQSITFVLYEREVAATFKDVLHRKTALGNVTGLNVSGNESASDKNSNTEDSSGSNSSSEDSDDDSESEDDLPFIDFPQKETEDPGIHNTSTDNFIASLCTRIETDMTSVHDKLLAEIRKVFLYKDNVQDKKTLKKLRPKDCEEIEKTAVDCGVLIKWLDRGEKIEVCGRDHEVNKIILIVRNKLLETRTLQAEKQIAKQQKSTGHFSYSLHPPTYWKIHDKSMFKEMQELVFNRKLINVNDLERKSVIKLVQATWNSKLVGVGKDGAHLRHKNIEVIKVKRLEHKLQWEAYSFARGMMLRRLNSESSKKSCCTPIENLKGSSGPVKTTHIIPKHSPLCREMYPEVNEHYLFHGFKKEFKKAIVNHGLDSRLASENAMLGRGLYASESSTKADQYTDSKTNRTKGDKMMILMRVLLGTPYLSTSQNPYKFSRPPCKKCFKDKCACPNSTHFDSVIDNYDKRNFREFVVYQGCQCYPEYFIVYNRV